MLRAWERREEREGWETYPRDQTLVEPKDASSRPNSPVRLKHRLSSVGSHLGLEDLEGLTEGGDFELMDNRNQKEKRKESANLVRRVEEGTDWGGGGEGSFV